MKFGKSLLLLCFFTFSLQANPCVPHLFSVGAGYWDAGSNHSGGLFQAEYKWGGYFCRCIRPQVEIMTAEFHSVFVGIGAAIELYLTDHIVFCPNFSPGLYYGGKGKNLGYPIEFRSALEIAYEFSCKARFGVQFYHISNAHLSHKNPGANAITGYLGFPL